MQAQAAEDETRKLLDQAYTDKNQELQDYYADLYRKVIAENDRLATALFTDKTNEGLPWVDYLAVEKWPEWNKDECARLLGQRRERHPADRRTRRRRRADRHRCHRRQGAVAQLRPRHRVHDREGQRRPVLPHGPHGQREHGQLPARLRGR
jgi:hypothetical protein